MTHPADPSPVATISMMRRSIAGSIRLPPATDGICRTSQALLAEAVQNGDIDPPVSFAHVGRSAGDFCEPGGGKGQIFLWSLFLALLRG